MKHNKNEEQNVQQKDILEQVQEILEERGRKALEMAIKTVMQEEIESKEVREALKYFMTQYWHDIARPALLSLVCEAVGGDPNITTPVAVPLSLISGAIDIHDDIIDGSKIKDSRPTVLGKFGKDVALLVGDALIFKGFALLNQAAEQGIPSEKVPVIIDIVKRTFFELGDAEALELQFRGRRDVTPEEYLKVVKKKAADVEAHTRISAILGNGSKEQIEALAEYGRLLGMLIILRDDFIDMIDFKEAVHRISKEHLSLPILYALQNPEIRSTLNPLFLKKTITKRDAKRILEVVDEAGGINRLEKLMQNLVRDTHSHLEKIKKNREYLDLLIEGMLLPTWRDSSSATTI